MDLIFSHSSLFWLILGLMLASIELYTGFFVALSSGVAALVLAIWTFFLEPSPDMFFMEFMCFSILTVMFSIVAIKVWNPKNLKSNTTGGIDFYIDNAVDGVVRSFDTTKEKGVVFFKESFMGSKEWNFTGVSLFEKDDLVSIKAVKGNSLIVEKIEDKGE